MGAIVTDIVMGDALEYTTVTGGVIVVAVTGDIMRNILQRKKHLLCTFPMAEDMNTSRRVIVNTPGDRDPNNVWYTADIWISRQLILLTELQLVL